jgi:hypothetical protein
MKVQRGNSGQMQVRRNRLLEMDNEIKTKLATWNDGPGRRRPKKDENHWLEGEGRGQTGME